MNQAFAIIGMSPNEFWDLTWYEYECRTDSFGYMHDSNWDRTRWVGEMLTATCTSKTVPKEKLVSIPRFDKFKGLKTAEPTEKDLDFFRRLK